MVSSDLEAQRQARAYKNERKLQVPFTLSIFDSFNFNVASLSGPVVYSVLFCFTADSRQIYDDDDDDDSFDLFYSRTVSMFCMFNVDCIFWSTAT